MDRMIVVESDVEAQVLTVVDAIPTGRNNAIKRDALCAKVGMSDRKVRKMIELARVLGFIIINEQNGSGYYQSDDLDEIERQYKQDTARAMSILARRKEIRRRLRAAGRKV